VTAFILFEIRTIAKKEPFLLMSRQFNLRKSRTKLNLAQNILRKNKTEINKLQKEWLPMPFRFLK